MNDRPNDDKQRAEAAHEQPQQQGTSAEAAPAADSGQQEPAVEEQLQQAQDTILRLQAELENTRRRLRRELEDRVRFASGDLMRDLLPVKDNIDRALQAAEANKDSAGLLEGVQMMAQQLMGVLRQHSCVPIEAEGQAFDPHYHEAIARQPSAEHEPGTILAVAQPGYRLHDRVLRPAQVVVAADPDGDGSSDRDQQPANSTREES